MSGIEFFSGFEVIRAAMEVEKNGHRFYSAMAEAAGNPLAQEIFSWLAQDEVGHLRTLENLLSQYEEGAFWENEEEFLPYLRQFSDRDIFPSREELQAVLAAVDGDLGAMDLAIRAEERFADFFRRAAEHARTPDGKKAFAWLTAEEERHARVLKERREQLTAQHRA